MIPSRRAAPVLLVALSLAGCAHRSPHESSACVLVHRSRDRAEAPAQGTDRARAEVKPAEETREAQLAIVKEIDANEAQIYSVEAKLDDETRFTDDAELRVIEAKLDAHDDTMEAADAGAAAEGSDFASLAAAEAKLDDDARFVDDSELSVMNARLGAGWIPDPPLPGVPASSTALNEESYAHAPESSFARPVEAPLSTFSIDVDTASYSNVRRFLEGDRLPPPEAVRSEELLNYFRYDDPEPVGKDPFSVSSEIADCPWAENHRLLRIGLRGRRIPHRDLPARHLVFVVDVSGSMENANKLPLVKSALRMLVEHLDERDRISLVVYANGSRVAMEPTSGADRNLIFAALDPLVAEGSTDGSEALVRAYDLADRSFIEGGINRLVLCSDGDFNMGVTNQGALVQLIERERAKGVFLTVLGFGMGNLKDSMMEALADHGNGNYAYIDSLDEAEKVLMTEADATLVTIAKDVKIQVELNPALVEAYRLVGYDNRRLAAEDFNDDLKDAGEIGAGHSVTALYEIVPKGQAIDRPKIDALRYQDAPKLSAAATSGEIATVKLRYKLPDGERSELIEGSVIDDGASLRSATDDLRFAAAVATFGLVLHESEHSGTASLELARELGADALGADAGGLRAAFLRLVDRARELKPAVTAEATR